MCTKPHQVIQNACYLVKQDANVLRTQRDFDAEQIFNSHNIGMLIAHHRYVVEAIHVANALIVWLRLSKLFRRAMQQTDVRIGFLNSLAVNFENQA